MKRKHIIILHIIFWSLLFATKFWGSTSTHSFSRHKPEVVNLYFFIKYFIIDLTYFLIPLSCFYGSYLIVAPQLGKRNYGKAVFYAILTFVFVAALRYAMEYYFFLPVFGYDNYNGHPYSLTRFVDNVFFFYFPAYFLYGLLYFFISGWYKTRQDQLELQKEKASAELTFLRSQVNPHFLFNSINDIYSLTYQQSPQAPVALLKLSEILRYMLREGNEDTMPLQSEIKYLESVVELQRISAKGKAYIDFTVEGYIGGQKIATLLLIAFVENAFKHGVLNDPHNPVEIKLRGTPGSITFTVSNKKNKDEKDKTGGIGLSNVRRRLELMYPNTHHLAIEDASEFYTVNLELQLL